MAITLKYDTSGDEPLCPPHDEHIQNCSVTRALNAADFVRLAATYSGCQISEMGLAGAIDCSGGCTEFRYATCSWSAVIGTHFVCSMPAGASKKDCDWIPPSG